MLTKSIKGLFCLLLFQLLTLFFVPQILLAREIEIDGTLKVELVNNEMSYEDSIRVFNYVKSSHYDRGYYRDAEKGFQKIVDYAASGRKSAATGFFRRLTGKDHDDFDMKDDALYYIGKCKYHGKSRGTELEIFEQVYRLYPDGDIVKSGELQSKLLNIFGNSRGTDLEIFEQVYHLYPNGNVVKSGQLQDTLLNILDKESINFNRMMRIYHFIAKISHKYRESALRIIEKKVDEKRVIRWKVKADMGRKYEERQLREHLKKISMYRDPKLYSDFYEDCVSYVWGHFCPFDDISNDQRKSIISLVKKNSYIDLASAHFYENQIVVYDQVIEIQFRDVLEATGINLFDIEKEEADDI